MNVAEKNLSEIDLVPIIEDVLDTKSWNFKLSYSILREYDREYFPGFFMRKIIYASEWCRIRFNVYQRRKTFPDMYEVSIWYGRLHAPNEKEKMIWKGEECHCWHSIGSTHLYFLEGVSPSEIIKHPSLAVFEEARASQYETIRSELGDFSPIHRESVIWKHYGVRLFELFDLRHPDLWDEYVKFLQEYYRKSSSSLWMVC